MQTGDIVIVGGAHTDTPQLYRIRRMNRPDLREYDGSLYTYDGQTPPVLERGDGWFRVTTPMHTLECDTLPLSWDGCLIGAVREV